MKMNLTQIITAFCLFLIVSLRKLCISDKNLLSINMTYSPRISQYGFKENCSTQQALIDIVNKIQLNFDKRNYTHAEYL